MCRIRIYCDDNIIFILTLLRMQCQIVCDNIIYIYCFLFVMLLYFWWVNVSFFYFFFEYILFYLLFICLFLLLYSGLKPFLGFFNNICIKSFTNYFRFEHQQPYLPPHSLSNLSKSSNTSSTFNSDLHNFLPSIHHPSRSHLITVVIPDISILH